MALEPAAIHRIATITASTFDTLPIRGAIIIMLGMADLKHRDGYPPVMLCTVVMTGLLLLWPRCCSPPVFSKTNF